MYCVRRQLTSVACWLSIVSTLICNSFIAGHAAAEPQQKSILSEQDKQFLDKLIAEFLFDPKGAQRVLIQNAVRDVWGAVHQTTMEGWLVPSDGAKPPTVFLADGFPIPLQHENDITRVDFVAVCGARYDAAKKQDGFDQMRRNAVGIVDNDLALAAWLHRLSHDNLAAKALASARKWRSDPREQLRNELAWSAFSGMVHAYMVRADDEALAHGDHLLRLYSGEAKKRFPQSTQILREINRRRQTGARAQHLASQPPDDFKRWETKRQVSFLLDALDEVDARQLSQPGGIDLASDWRVRELINLGDAAVPDLIETLENDERLTRSVHFWRDFSENRTVLSVREAALTATMSILGTLVFEPRATGDNFTAYGDRTAKETAKILRDYWTAYGHLPFDERMMTILADPKASMSARREAAQNLATLNQRQSLQTTIRPTYIGVPLPQTENPAVKKFNNPTVAEAILAAMAADLNVYDAEPNNKDKTYRRRVIHDEYVWSLVKLGDTRIASEAAKHATAAATLHERFVWAHAAHDLGGGNPFEALANEFRTGKISIAQINSASIDHNTLEELEYIIRALISARTTAADGALYALADPKHPEHDIVIAKLMHLAPGSTSSPMPNMDSPWFAHPYCISVLRTGLNEQMLTGAIDTIEDNSLRRKFSNGFSGAEIPSFLADPGKRHGKIEERRYHIAAETISRLVIGAPRYHPLLKDADQQLARLKSTIEQFGGNLRRLSRRERQAALASRSEFDGPFFIPDIHPLGRAAMAADVNAGKAIFYLDQESMPANIMLPAIATLKSDPARHVLIMQAETRSDGEIVLGAILQDDIRTILARDVADIKSLAEQD
jgi:hypothetical protein